MVQLDNCDFLELSPENPITGFDCGDSDLNDFFNHDFSFVFSTEQQEKENLKKMVAEDEILFTRQMFYDMERWKK